MTRLLATVFTLPLLLSATALAADDLLEVRVTKDLPYVAGDDVPDRQKLDLYVPKGEGPWPVLLWIHGGAWAVGHRSQEAALARRFAERGIAVASADHRMSKATWMNPKLDEGIEHPEHVKDVASAFAWLRKNAKAHRLDPQRMFVGGFSSGAHLAALLATDPRYLKAHGIEPSALKGAVPVGGAYDMEAYYKAHLEANGKAMADGHVLDVFGHGEGALKDASPLTHVKKTNVPMLVLSEKDTHGYTTLFEKAVEEAGITRIRFRHFLDRRHATIGRLMAREGPDEARDAIVAFVRDPSAKSE
jgi:dienelactone hydrolase